MFKLLCGSPGIETKLRIDQAGRALALVSTDDFRVLREELILRYCFQWIDVISLLSLSFLEEIVSAVDIYSPFFFGNSSLSEQIR